MALNWTVAFVDDHLYIPLVFILSVTKSMIMRLSIKSLIVPILFLALFACEDQADTLSVEKSEPTLSDDIAGARGNGVVESVTGSGHITAGDGLRVFTFNARKKADGSVSGVYHLNIQATGLKVKGSIECFTIEGNVAYLAGLVDRSNSEAAALNPPSGFMFKVTDNGQGANAAADQISLTQFNTELTEDVLDGICGDPSSFDFLDDFTFDVEAGNIQIH